MEYGRQWLLAAGAVGLLWAVLWLALPSVIAQQLQEKASQAIGRALTVRSVEVAPWSLAVTVYGLEVAGLPGQAPALSIERTSTSIRGSLYRDGANCAAWWCDQVLGLFHPA